MDYKPLPIGIDDFKSLILNDYYYVDKSLFIKELLDYKGMVNLFSRPRRFGKTLNLSMLRYFFEKTPEPSYELFHGLAIMNEGNKYTSCMGKYPVISLSLKSGKQPSFDMAVESIKDEIIGEYNRHNDVVESSKILENEKKRFKEIQNNEATPVQFAKALKFLSDCLFKDYEEKVIILIDEYDVPLENAYFCGFYQEMIEFIRSLFESALKTNLSLEFAVVTGCLRISKESIFTGLNNLKILSITDSRYSEHFGFTEYEVAQMLEYYRCSRQMATIKKWYDGYRFGFTDVFNPWSVLNYTDRYRADKDALPQPYWSNTSSNSIVKMLIEKADMNAKQEIEELIDGGSIIKLIHEDSTYEDINKSQDNLWNFLFFTGYLKKVNEQMLGDERYLTMAIPNTEVKTVYKSKILEWFENKVEEKDLSNLYSALLAGDHEILEKQITILLRESISFYDNAELFYHGFLIGVLGRLNDFIVDSNRESGDGRYDIKIRSLDVEKPVIILELKVADCFMNMEKCAAAALDQISRMHYGEELTKDGYTSLICYGIAFYKKNCKVLKVEKELPYSQ
ncbi:AAA family ATPase [Robinsoniella peoriensis]